MIGASRLSLPSLALLAALSAEPVRAQEQIDLGHRSTSVTAGIWNDAYTLSGVNPGCTQFRGVTLTITKAPQKGRARLRKIPQVINEAWLERIRATSIGDVREAETIYQKCRGQRFDSIVVGYRPNAGATGNDEMELVVVFPKLSANSGKMRLSLRIRP